jgi:polyphosphate kinase
MNPQTKFFNRELSWLEFNQRVLDEARNPAIPVLERLKFLAITGSNLDEFFMVRVGGLQLLAATSPRQLDPVGLNPREQLAAIRERVCEMAADQYHCFENELMLQMHDMGICRANLANLTERQLLSLKRLFDEEIFTVLSPIAIDEGKPLPLMISGQIYACVRLAYAPQKVLHPFADPTATERFAIIPLGETLPRIITIPAENRYEFVLLEDVVEHFVQRFFPGEEILDFAPFRVVLNADIELREDGASDLMGQMVETLDARAEAACVRLEVVDEVSEAALGFLMKGLEVLPEQVYRAAGPLKLSDFMKLGGISGFEYAKYERWPPQPSPDYDSQISVFKNMRRGDILLYHPYQSFDAVVELIKQAADDADVLAIKQTLYRVSGNSALVKALIRAAENGKSVTVVVELKARFDEQRNITWARQLEQAGATVLYGVKGLKTHAKICVVTRRDADGIRRYCHFGTGNYNEITASIYSDASLLSCDPELGADATDFFNAITGYTQPSRFRKISAAPIGLRERLIEMIDFEINQAQRKQVARISAKINSLTDPAMIEKLYEASAAGVNIRLNVRGICCLRPGVPGLSENIQVISIVDRFLEHARIIQFHHGGDQRVFISSADWMNRNLSRRVELLTPIESRQCKNQLIEILDSYFRDNQKAKQLQADGAYLPVPLPGDRQAFRCQEWLYEMASEQAKLVKRGAQMMLQPHFSSARK